MGRGSATKEISAKPATRSSQALSPTARITERLRDLPSEQLANLETQLKPHQSSRTGFLGKDENLLEVIEADVQALAAVGTIPQEVGLRLREFIAPFVSYNRLAQEGLSKKYNIPEHFEIRVGGFTKGFQQCPFEDQECGATCGTKDMLSERDSFSSEDFSILNLKTGEEVRGPGLVAHLAVCHNFFEGDVPYRPDPVKLARVMELI